MAENRADMKAIGLTVALDNTELRSSLERLRGDFVFAQSLSERLATDLKAVKAQLASKTHEYETLHTSVATFLRSRSEGNQPVIDSEAARAFKKYGTELQQLRLSLSKMKCDVRGLANDWKHNTDRILVEVNQLMNHGQDPPLAESSTKGVTVLSSVDDGARTPTDPGPSDEDKNAAVVPYSAVARERELDRLRQQVREVNSQFERYKSGRSYSADCVQCAIFERAVDSFRVTVAKKTVAEKVLQDKLARSLSNESAQKAENDDLRRQLAKVEAKVESSENMTTSMQTEFKKWIAANKKLEDDRDVLLQERTSLLAELHDLKSAVSTLQEESSTLTETASGIANENEGLKEMIGNLENERDALRTDNEQLRQTTARSQEVGGDAVAHLQKLLTAREQDCLTLTESLSTCNEELGTCRAELQSLKNELGTVKQKHQNLSGEYHALERKHGMLENKYGGRLEQLKAFDEKHKKALALNEQFRQKEATLQSLVAELRAEKENLAERMNELMGQLGQANTSVAEEKKKTELVDGLESRIRELQSEVTSLRGSGRAAKMLSNELNQSRQLVASLQTKCNANEELLDTANRYHRHLRRRFLRALRKREKRSSLAQSRARRLQGLRIRRAFAINFGLRRQAWLKRNQICEFKKSTSVKLGELREKLAEAEAKLKQEEQDHKQQLECYKRVVACFRDDDEEQ